jgi:hypothetical protein
VPQNQGFELNISVLLEGMLAHSEAFNGQEQAYFNP